MKKAYFSTLLILPLFLPLSAFADFGGATDYSRTPSSSNPTNPITFTATLHWLEGYDGQYCQFYGYSTTDPAFEYVGFTPPEYVGFSVSNQTPILSQQVTLPDGYYYGVKVACSNTNEVNSNGRLVNYSQSADLETPPDPWDTCEVMHGGGAGIECGYNWIIGGAAPSGGSTGGVLFGGANAAVAATTTGSLMAAVGLVSGNVFTSVFPYLVVAAGVFVVFYIIQNLVMTMPKTEKVKKSWSGKGVLEHGVNEFKKKARSRKKRGLDIE